MGKSLSLALYLATLAGRGGTHDDPAPGAAPGADPRPAGPLIWFHTGSDSQALAVRELVRRMRAERDELRFLLTSGEAPDPGPDPAIEARRAPEDKLTPTRRFLDHWRPAVAIWTEPDLRPVLITEADNRDIPMFLVDARTAPPDLAGWRFWRGMSKSLMERFRKVLTGDAETAAALQKLGADPQRIELAGYLEEGTPALPCNDAERGALADLLGGRPVWLATHVMDDEFPVVIEAHQRAQRRAHRLLLILVPDDPTIGAALARTLTHAGLNVALRSDGEEPGADTQVYIADTEGEAGLWYRLAPMTFLGRSLGPHGGANPFEPAALGSAIIHGPNTARHPAAYDRLAGAGATQQVRDAAELGDTVELLLSPDMAAGLAHQAWKICTSGAEVTDRIKDLILTTLDEAEEA